MKRKTHKEVLNDYAMASNELISSRMRIEDLLKINEKLQKELDESKHQVTRLSARLDAVLYSLVLMQDHLKGVESGKWNKASYQFNEATKSWEQVFLAE